MKKILYSGFVALAISISFVQQAGASSGDARSFALGGASTGLSNDAFTVLHNPAGMVNLKWGSFILPLSPSLYTTNNLGWSNFINKTVSTATFAGIFDEMKKTNNASIKIDNTSIIPIFGFSGKPFTGLNVLGQPVAFGLNVWAKAQADVNLDISSGMLTIANELVNAGTEGLNISKQLSDSSTQLNGILQKFNELSPKFSSLTSSASLTNMDSVAKDLKDMQSSTLTPLITEGKTTIDSFKTTKKNLDNIFTSITNTTKTVQNLTGNVVGDGHVVVAVSGASRVYYNKFDDVPVDVSVGLNVKGFFFPYNIKSSQISSNLETYGMTGNFTPIAVKLNADLGPFNSLAEVKSTLDSKLNPLLSSASDILNTGESLNNDLSGILNDYSKVATPLLLAGKINNLNTNANALMGQVTELQKNIGSVAELQKLATDSQTKIVDDLKNVKMSMERIEEIAPAGVGLDLGVQAKIRNDITVGLMLENPLVIWPANKVQRDINLNTSQLFDSNMSVDKLISVGEAKSLGSTNYTLSEPTALKLGASYRMDNLTPVLIGATFAGDLEQVFNGRPLALNLGFEKFWAFNNTFGLSARLGTHLGGMANMFTLGLGAKLGVCSVDIGYGATNPLNPLSGTSTVLAVSTSLNF